MTRYKVKPYTIEAMQFTYESAEEVNKWLGGNGSLYRDRVSGSDKINYDLRLHTLTGTTQVMVGDYVIKDECGYVSKMGSSDFHKKYEVANEQ